MKKQRRPSSPTKTKKGAKQVQKKPGRVKLWVSLAFVSCMGVFGWVWTQQLTCQEVLIYGSRYAQADTLRMLADVDSTMPFFDLDQRDIAERVMQDPWVAHATVKRHPDSRLAITVTERVPAVLVLDDHGRPARFLDQDGFQFPYRKEAVFDVPIVQGLTESFHTSQQIEHKNLRQLLPILRRIPENIDALLSTFSLQSDGSIALYTTPKPGRGSIHVRLGHGDYEQKLDKLHAFWHQAVLVKQDVNIETIDLRFDSQIITREVRLSQ